MPKLSKSRIIRCMVCSKTELNPTSLLSHIREVHQKNDIDEYRCPLCNQSLDQLWKLQRHLSKCSQNKPLKQYFRTTKEDFQKYRELSQEAGFDFALNLAKNMSVPRNSVFEVIGYVQIFLKSIGEGMKNLVIPSLKEDEVHNFENAVSIIINESFKKIYTEHKFDDVLSKKELISPLRKVPLEDSFAMDVDDDESSEAETDYNEDDIYDNSGYDSDDRGAGNNDEEESLAEDEDDGENVSYGVKSKTVTLMDVHFQIKKFFELPNVFNKIKSNTDRITKMNKLNHFINGKIWKRKLQNLKKDHLQNFKKDDIVIPYHLHIDDTQTNNSLGTHITNGDQTCVYYSFPTIPNEYIARLKTIFTALLFESSLSKKYGNDKCYEALIEELNKLADDGIIVNVDGKEQKIFFVMGLLLGDNKGVNNCLGFPGGFTAHYYCRMCRLRREQMQYSYEEDKNNLRNYKNYEEDLLLGNGNKKTRMKLTGIYENSPFNKIRYFHATDSCADIMHDVNEGILHYNTCEVILHFIKKTKKYFKLSMLNEEKRKKDYGEIEENNRSSTITMKHLKNRKLKMTASEMYSFVHHLPFILLNIVEREKRAQFQNDEVWRFLLITIRFLDMCYMTCYDDSSIKTLRKVIATMNEMYVRLFKETLKPKHHYATHYPTLIEKFGPLRYMSSMRYEAKHKFVKSYTKNTISRKNISYSLGRKLQYEFAHFLKGSVALEDHFESSKAKLKTINDEDFFPLMKPSSELDSLSEQPLFVCDKVKINGVTLSSKLYLPYINGNELQLFKIVKILMSSMDDASSIRIIYQKYAVVDYYSRYASYVVKDLLPEMNIMNVSCVINQRIYPVVLHDAVGLKMFRYKTF